MTPYTVRCTKCGNTQKIVLPNQIAWCTRTSACRKNNKPMEPTQ